MRLAIVGAGVSGMVSALELHARGHEVTVFERAARAGGHTMPPGARSVTLKARAKTVRRAT